MEVEKCINCGAETEGHASILTKRGTICLGCEFKKIDVWHLSLKGEGNYMIDKSKENLQLEIDEDTDGNEYELIKHKMGVIEYFHLPEFEGF